jgi:predicted ribosome quality control (RQC) complex YloA/Tae2 family protein
MNNFQNDTVSTHLAEGDDMWFHVKNYHGSHVLLKAKKDIDFSDSDLEEAAGYAAYYSEVKDSEKVEVDFTPARFIKKPNGSKPGFITYKNHKTALVSPRKMK